MITMKPKLDMPKWMHGTVAGKHLYAAHRRGNLQDRQIALETHYRQKYAEKGKRAQTLKQKINAQKMIALQERGEQLNAKHSVAALNRYRQAATDENRRALKMYQLKDKHQEAAARRQKLAQLRKEYFRARSKEVDVKQDLARESRARIRALSNVEAKQTYDRSLESQEKAEIVRKVFAVKREIALDQRRVERDRKHQVAALNRFHKARQEDAQRERFAKKLEEKHSKAAARREQTQLQREMEGRKQQLAWQWFRDHA
eukprot:g6239.t1